MPRAGDEDAFVGLRMPAGEGEQAFAQGVDAVAGEGGQDDRPRGGGAARLATAAVAVAVAVASLGIGTRVDAGRAERLAEQGAVRLVLATSDTANLSQAKDEISACAERLGLS